MGKQISYRVAALAHSRDVINFLKTSGSCILVIRYAAITFDSYVNL